MLKCYFCDYKQKALLFATQHRKLVIFICFILTAFFGYYLSKIEFGNNLEDFFDKEEKEYKFEKEFFSQFKRDIPYSAVVGVKHTKVLTYSDFQKLDSFTNQLKQFPQVSKLFSITNSELFKLDEEDVIPYKLINLANQPAFDSSFEVFNAMDDQRDHFLSKDRKSTFIYLIFEDTVSTKSLIQLQKFSDSLIKTHNLGKVVLINQEHNNYLIIKKIKADTNRLIVIAVILILLVLLYFFRSWVGIVVPFIVVVTSIIWVMGSISLFGFSLNVLTIAIPVIVGVISLSDVIHIISRYSEEETTDKYLKIKATKKDILKAIVLTTVTTSFGFLSLATMQIPVFKQFALFTALGVFYAFLLAYFLLPVLLYYVKKIKLHNHLHKLTPKKVWTWPTLIVTLMVLVLSVVGISRVKQNNYFYENLNQNDEITDVMLFSENDMHGLRDLIITASVKDSTQSVLSGPVLRQLNQLEKYIKASYGAVIDLSLATRVKQVNRAINGGEAAFFEIPKDEFQLNLAKSELLKNGKALGLRGLVSTNKNATYIQTHIKDIGSYETTKKNNELLLYAQTNLPSIEIDFSGKAHIIDRTNVNVSEGMIWNLLIIVILIFIILTYIFKSWRIGFFSLFPNILPLVVITAVVGWFDFGMNIGTTIVYTIAFGIAVDDTIHFLGRYKIELDKGVENIVAIQTAMSTSGGAIFLTTLVLVCGFGVLITSNFYANYLTGLLVCIGMITALVCDLYLLPVILQWVRRNK